MTSGCRYLGGFVGENHLESARVKEKVQNWVEAIESLSNFASLAPQSSYAGMQIALQHDWTITQRAIPCESEVFEPREDTIESMFLSMSLGHLVGKDF